MKIEVIRPVNVEAEAIVAAAFDNAIRVAEEEGFDLETLLVDAEQALVACAEIPAVGGSFLIPLLAPEEHPTGDNRYFEKGSLTVRDLPLPLLWQPATDEGHKKSYIVGRIDSIERVGPAGIGPLNNKFDGLGNAVGVFDTSPLAREAERMVRNGFLNWVSVDLDEFEGEVDSPEIAELADDDGAAPAKRKIKNDRTTVNAARATAATLVAKPAFQEVKIQIVDSIVDDTYGFEPEVIEDGEYMDDGFLDDYDYQEASLVASAAPVVPPRKWLSNPKLNGPTPLTVEDDGRVFGHIALWKTDHIAYGNQRVKPPRSSSGYSYFRTGVIRCDDGSDVPVGQLTLVGGHASMSLSADAAKSHYDNTMSGVVDVSAGEDQYGIWVAGALRPGVTPEQVRVLRASALSGDWRPINGRLELVAICSVPVPGFPNPRAMVAGGQVVALVAAGASELLEMRKTSMEDRLHALEQRELERESAEARKMVEDFANETLVASALNALETLDDFSAKEQENMTISYNEALKRLGME